MFSGSDSEDTTFHHSYDRRRRRRRRFMEDREDSESRPHGDRHVANVRSTAKQKKGRGFQMEHRRHVDDFCHKYEGIQNNITEISDDDDFDGTNFPQRSVEGWQLFVTNLHDEIQEEDIVDKFGDYGPIRNMHLNLDRRTGYVKGYCIVQYDTYSEALLAKEGLDKSKILGQTISVDWAFVKHPRKYTTF